MGGNQAYDYLFFEEQRQDMFELNVMSSSSLSFKCMKGNISKTQSKQNQPLESVRLEILLNSDLDKLLHLEWNELWQLIHDIDWLFELNCFKHLF